MKRRHARPAAPSRSASLSPPPVLVLALSLAFASSLGSAAHAGPKRAAPHTVVRRAAQPLPPRATPPAKTPAEPTLPGERAFNECVKVPRGQRVKLTLRPRSSLEDLVGWISAMTCKRFIVPQRIAAQRVTLLAPRPINAREAYRAFISALQVIGLTVVATRRTLKVMPARWAVRSALPLYRHRQRRRLPRGDAMVTQLLRVQQAKVAQLLPLLNRLKSQAGDVTSWVPTNTLILTDTAANVRRLVAIVEALDEPLLAARVHVLALSHLDAGETTRLLSGIFTAAPGQRHTAGRAGQRRTAPRPRRASAPRVLRGAASAAADAAARARTGRALAAAAASAPRFFAAPGSTRLIVIATPEQLARVRAVLTKIDVPDGGARPKLWIYKLRYGDAEAVSQALAKVASGSGSAPSRRSRSRSRSRGGRRGGSASGSATATLFEGLVKVGADKTNNSLLIRATPRDYVALRAVLLEMDKPRPQVFVEAYILEVTLNKTRDVGVAYHGGGTVDGNLLLGGTSYGTSLNSATLSPLSLMGLAAGVQGAGIPGSATLLGLDNDIPSFGVIFSALSTHGNVNVLSSPQLLTSDNKKAQILVGENIPLRSGAAAPQPSAAGGDTQSSALNLLALVQPVTRKDVGIKLTVTPTIGAADSLRLKIKQEVSAVADRDFGGLGASTSKRQVESTVVVNNQQTVVIGGLMRDSITESVSKVPLLGDIPLLGALFRKTNKVKTKTNLLIVLTPYIIRDKRDLARILHRKLEERRAFMRRNGTRHNRDALLGLVNFRRKRGLLGEIARVARAVERDAAKRYQSR